ncbi:desmoplakin-B-like [Brachionichthys hirsutus]|uniref:desmoplakin-B-like n=1 Tax=Brachionichthys hirsutus TaxID=412623 RepID=UPI003604E97C
MSVFGSQKELSMSRRVGSKGDLAGGGSHYYARSEVIHGGGNGYDAYVDGYNTYTGTKTSMRGMGGGMGGGIVSGMSGGMGSGMGSGMGGGIVSGMSGGMGSGMGSGMGGGIVSGMSGGMGSGMGSGMGGGIVSGMSGGMGSGMGSGMGGGMGSGMGGGIVSGMGSGVGGGIVSGMSGGMGSGMGSGIGSGMGSGMSAIHQKAVMLQSQCQDHLMKAEHALQSGSTTGDAERYMGMARDTIEQLKSCAVDLRQMGQPNDNVVRTMEMCKDQLKGVHKAFTGSLQRRRSNRGSSGAWEEPGRSFQDAMGWISQQKRLIETASWGDDPAAIDQQLISHKRFHSAIQRSPEVDQARDDLLKKGDKANLHALDQEWDGLQKMSFGRSKQLQDLQQIIQEISKEIMWVNDREEEELMFDWGDKNISQYIPRKQESYSNLMSALEAKEKDLNKLKARVDAVLKNNHPAADKIEAYRDTLQTQWSWLLQISKCIDIHLKENHAYSQFFKEANETYSNLQKEHETVRMKFTCDRNTSLGDLQQLLNGLEREKEKIVENKRQVQRLVSSSKNIVRLKPRNPEDKSAGPVIVKALCDFKQDQKVICKGDEAILKNNNQRSKWEITGPGGLDMSVPSVCLIVPPPNPLSISLANKNDQYYEAILSIWNQLYINVKSLIAWRYCVQDIRRINSLTISMLARMRPEEYRQIIKSLEARFAEFKVSSLGSQIFADEDKRAVEEQFTGAQAHYDQLVEQLPPFMTKAEPARRKVSSSSSSSSAPASHSLTELHALRLRLEAAEGTLSQHVHVCVGDDGVNDCGLKITQLETVQRDVDSLHEDFLRLRERIARELEETSDPDKAQFLRSELGTLNQRLGSLEGSSSASLRRLRALRDMLESVARAEDIVKVHEARLMEKETTSLSPGDVEDYMSTLRNIKAELDNKKDVLASMEAELSKASHWNSQVGGPAHRCDMMLCRYTEQVGVLSDRWGRISGQIDTRLQDLLLYQPQLLRCKETSGSLDDWINATRTKQDVLQAAKIDDLQALRDHMSEQKALNGEIKAKREMLEGVLKDKEACVTAIKDYETDLASYASGLETLLNIPIKRTMLKSPSEELNQEVTQLQTRYLELLTSSGGYYKFLGELLRNMEELKIRNTRIDLLEEELRLLKDNFQDCNAKNKSLEDAVGRYKLDLSRSQDQLLSVEEVKQSTVLKCNAAKDSLDSSQSQLAGLNDQLTNLKYLLEEEKRKRRLAEERYTQQQVEYESVLRKRQEELETVSWSKVEVEKGVSSKDREIQQLRRQLAEEAEKIKGLQREMSKVRSKGIVEINKLTLNYESQIHISRSDLQRLEAQREEDAAELRLQFDRIVAERSDMEEALRRLRMLVNEAEERKKMAEEESRSQNAAVAEEGHKRRALERQVEVLMGERHEESQELAQVMRRLQEKSEEVAYITHSLEEEARRRRTAEEGQGVMDSTLAELQAKLTSSSVAVSQLVQCKEELQKVRTELERERRERRRVEQNTSRLQERTKDLQAVRDDLESQVENQRTASQDEVARRRQAEAELEKSTLTTAEYASTITMLRQSLDQAGSSEKRRDEACLKLQEELERSSRQKKASAEHMTKLGAELKALQQQLLQEQARVKEAKLKNEALTRTVEESSKALQDEAAALQSLKELTETQSRERLRMEEELRAAQRDKEELVRSKRGFDQECSAQIDALELQLRASVRSNKDQCSLFSELSSEREKLNVETENLQKQATETSTMMQSLQSQHKEIVTERDALLLKLQFSGTGKDHVQKLEEELALVKLSQESELRNKQRLLEENERVKRDLDYWKEQHNSKHGLIRQYDTDKERLEREKVSLKSEIDRLMKELRELEEAYKSKLAAIQGELQEVTIVKQNIETELSRREPHTGLLLLPISETLDPTKVIFDGVRKTVTAQQLLDCGVLDKQTFDRLMKGEKTVFEVSVEKKVFLKGTGSIAGVAAGPLGKMSLSEAKKKMLMPPESANLLLDAQAATGHIIDPSSNQKLTVEEACSRGVVDNRDRDRLLVAEAAAVGYRDPSTAKPLALFDAMKKGIIDWKTTLRLLQAQLSAGGILDPVLSIYLPKDIALNRDLIDEDLCDALNQYPECYLDPDTQQTTTYLSLKKKCKADPSTGLLLLPEPRKPLTVQGLRDEVKVIDLVDANLLERSDMDQLRDGILTRQDIEDRLRSYLRGSNCIAGVYDEDNEKIIPVYQAMKDGLLQPGTTLAMLEAQAASGFIVDPVNNLYLTVSDAYNGRLFGPEFKNSLLSAERAVTGYKIPGTDTIISLFEAIERGLVEKGHGIRLLEAQIASGGIIDPKHSHRIDVNVAYKRGYFNEEMNNALADQSVDSKGFFDPNTDENLTYMELKKRCMTDSKTGLILLPITDKKKQESFQKNTLRKRRVLIVDPETNKEMTVHEAYSKGYIDYSTYLELSEQECEWEEITITDPDGSTRFVINDRKTGRQYDITELLEKQVISQADVERYRSRAITLNQFADLITGNTRQADPVASSSSSSTSTSAETYSAALSMPLSPTFSKITTTKTTTVTEQNVAANIESPSSPDSPRNVSRVSLILNHPVENIVEQEPVGAIFDTDSLEKITITEALNRGLVDSITALRLLEAQACTGGIIDPKNGQRFGIQEASRLGIIDDNMASKLKPAQKAYVGFEDVKTRRKMSVPAAMKEMWLPYEAGQRFMEFQFVTGGLYDPEMGCRRSIEDAMKLGWMDARAAHKLQDARNHVKNLTCPKSKLKICYKEALDNCLMEESTGVKMLQASTVSSRGISSPYNVSSAPGSRTGSRTGSRSGSRRSSRRSSVDLGSSSSSTSHYGKSVTSTFLSTPIN